MSLGWYVKRLANMSPLEIAHRVAEQAKRAVSRRRSYGWKRFPAPAELRAVPGLADTLRSGATPVLRSAVKEEADRFLAGHFEALGTAWPVRDAGDLFPDDVWRLDPVTGRLWPGPEQFCFDLPYRHVRDLGDVKYVWEFNRLQFLQPLAASVALTGDARALAAIEAAIHGWARANPPFCGIGWNSGIELALRSVSLVVVDALCGDRLRPETRTLVGSVLHAHSYWLARYPSAYSSANNHLVAEALGIFAVTSVFPPTPDWRRLHAGARATLEREAGLQVFADGVGAEQSPTYGAFTAEMLLVADKIGRAFGAPLAAGLAERLGAFSTFIGWLADGRGRVPAIGDDDGGRVLKWQAAHEATYAASVARAIAGHFALATPVPAEGAADLREALFGRPETLPEPEGLQTFEAGGYTVVRERRGGRKLRFVLDHGPLGYLSIAAHGHADANAFTLSLDDEDVLVDPGTYLYHSGGAWRDWFRGTRAHNTIALAGLDQSLIAGPFNWRSKARARLDGAVPGESWSVTACHDGYVRRLGAAHVREVRALDRGIEILDTLPGQRGGLAAEATLQFGPGLTVRASSPSNWGVYKDELQLLKVEFDPVSHATDVFLGSAANGGWISPHFGLKQEAARLVWKGTIPEDGLRTTLTWR